MGMGFAPTWLRLSGEPPPPASQNHFNHCRGYCSMGFASGEVTVLGVSVPREGRCPEG